MTEHVTHVTHPLVQHKLTLMRQKETSTAGFRQLLREISQLLAYEVTRGLPMTTKAIETPMEQMEAPVLAGKKMALISILRAGNGLLDGVLELIPSARVGFVGLYRDEETLQPVQYYFKVPDALEDRMVIVVDPMLATGHSAIAAVDRIKETNPRAIKFVCLVASQQGIDAFHEHHSEIPLYTAAIDEKLDDKGYILPGLGDAGDRLYGTR